MKFWPWSKSERSSDFRTSAAGKPQRGSSDRERYTSAASGQLRSKKKFIIDPQFAQRFNAYATACFPNEIGALVRIVERPKALIAIDFAVLPQEVSPTYFEFTTEGQGQFQMAMAQNGRGQELAEWYGMIHSHPNMTPFMSSTDVNNLWKLAGNKCGFSLICSAHKNPENNYFSVNYAQGDPWPLMVERLPHNHGQQLAGIGEISADELAAIADEVAAKTARRPTSWRGPEYVPGPKTNYPSEPASWQTANIESSDSESISQQLVLEAPEMTIPDLDEQSSKDGERFEHWFSQQSASENLGVVIPELSELAEQEVIISALELAVDLNITDSGQAVEINRRLALREGLDYQHLEVLIAALGEYPYSEDPEQEAVIQKMIYKLSDKLDESAEW